MTQPSERPAPGQDWTPVAIEGFDEPIPAWLSRLPLASSPEEAVADIVDRILAAPTVEAVLRRPEVFEFSDLIDQECVIHGFRIHASQLDGWLKAYAVIDFTWPGKDAHSITTTSATSVLAALARTHALGGFPLHCTVSQVVLDRKGRNNPLYLGPPAESEALG